MSLGVRKFSVLEIRGSGEEVEEEVPPFYMQFLVDQIMLHVIVYLSIDIYLYTHKYMYIYVCIYKLPRNSHITILSLMNSSYSVIYQLVNLYIEDYTQRSIRELNKSKNSTSIDLLR
jgi:hypothetical protein